MMQVYKFENGSRVHFDPSEDTFGRVVNYTYRTKENSPISVNYDRQKINIDY